MRQRKIKAILIDTNENVREIYPIEYVDDLETIYQILECSTIDIVTRKFGDSYYDVICDDEALLRSEQRGKIAIVTLSKEGKPVEYILGNCIIVRHDADGNAESLTDEEIIRILRECSIKFKANGQIGLIASV